jgi:hypothetical protein
MHLTSDNKQRIAVSLSFLLEFYKVVMGTFLTIFVPQNCGEKTCSISDNVYNTNGIHLSATSFNFITFIVVLYFYVIEMKREYWSIEHLDIDVRKPNNYLDTEIEYYPNIKNEMIKLNYKYLYATNAAIIFLILNFIISTVSIYYHFAGITSLNSIASFLLLLSMKIKKAYFISHETIYNERKLSAYMNEPKTYNTIDTHYKILRILKIQNENADNNDNGSNGSNDLPDDRYHSKNNSIQVDIDI